MGYSAHLGHWFLTGFRLKINAMHNPASPLNWQQPDPFVHRLTVKPEDTDRLGHTNNVRYLAWLEQIAWDHITHLGCGWEQMERSGHAMAITRTELNYRFASYAGDQLQLGTWVTAHDGRFKCARAFQLIRERDAKTLLTAEMQFACIDLKNGRPAKMPEDFIAALDRGLQPT